MFKTNGKLLFSFLIIDKYYTPAIYLLRILKKIVKWLLFNLFVIIY